MVYKDNNKKNNIWIAHIYYRDKEGNRRQKKKRGFRTKREALAFEKDFKAKNEGSTSMLFSDFIDLYMDDMKSRLKASTLQSKRATIKKRILPFFGDRKLNEIDANMIREWQIEIMAEYSESTQKITQGILSSLFNYAVKYYDLAENPCKKAGSMGSLKSCKVNYWTHEEFNKFIECVDIEEYRVAYKTLYYTGMRIGELLALTKQDINLDENTISIDKTLQYINGEGNIIQTPKTSKSRRCISIPSKLSRELQSFITGESETNERVFKHTNASYRYHLIETCKRAGIKPIRLHDLRHSHASLLIALDVKPLVISERLGHESITTTLNTYSHLFPDEQVEAVKLLDDLL